MITHITKEGSRFDDFDFKEVMKYAPFDIGDIEEIIACIPGEAEGPSWHYICKLKNRKYGYVYARCDYTGWGCQEKGEGKIFDTKKELFSALPEKEEDYKERKIKKTLINQIKGIEPYGLITLE